MEKLLQEVLNKIKPEEEDREKLENVVNRLMDRAEKIIKKRDINVKTKLVGSAARGTWLKGEKDIDLFILFPEKYPRDELEDKGLELARRIARDKCIEQFAEHPYLKANIEGFDVDIVPCYDIEDPGKLKSSVDRSPHHQEYIKSQITSKIADQVIILKGFFCGIEVYGSDLSLKGFSGYLAELLILYFNSFKNLIRKAKNWGKGEIIDFTQKSTYSEDIYRIFPDQPFIVLDPVDLSRNVAAAVSEENFAKFVRACEDFDREPDKKFFFPKTPDLSKDDIRKVIKRRETTIFTIVFDTPSDLVKDIIYPQLRKTKSKIIDKLSEHDFKVLRGDVYSNSNKSIIVLELCVPDLPRTYRHQGPPLGVKSYSFIKKHINSDGRIAGPFIDATGNLVFELERKYTCAEKVIIDSLKNRYGFGKHVSESIKRSYDILRGDELTKIIDDESKIFFSKYLTKCLPWYR